MGREGGREGGWEREKRGEGIPDIALYKSDVRVHTVGVLLLLVVESKQLLIVSKPGTLPANDQSQPADALRGPFVSVAQHPLGSCNLVFRDPVGL